ncbi:MAG TPA: hypothetical protein PLL92_07170 [Alicycliphilus sp.]|nr:hypothetical protein [Alicycliphilus sp.]
MAFEPINYSQQVADPFAQAVQGFQIGDAIRQRQIAQQQALQEQQRQQAAQAEVQGIMSNPNASSSDLLRAITLLPPQVAAQVNKAWEGRTQEQQAAALSHATKAYAALKNGRPDLAAQLFEERATALENSGQKEQAAQFRAQAQAARNNPVQTGNMLGLSIAAMPGGKDAIESFGKIGMEQRAQDMAPAALRKANADATTAEITAKYADSQAVTDLQKKGWDIKAVIEDIAFKRESNRIAMMNAAIAKENNGLRRQELQLKIDDAIRARDDKVRERVATAESGANSIDNMLNTIERVKTTPGLNSVLGSIEGRLPSLLSDDGANAIAMIETLSSQAFLAQIPNIKGMGALSNAEGEKLQSALQSLSRTQSETRFRENLDEAARLLKKGREALSRSTGVPLSKPDTPAAPGSRPPLDSFFK